MNKLLYYITILTTLVFSQQTNGVELGDATYRKSYSSYAGERVNYHGHNGVFGGFWVENGSFKMRIYEIRGKSWGNYLGDGQCEKR